MKGSHVEGQALLFFERYSRGEVPAGAIDDYVARWHEGADGYAQTMTLHDYLGLTKPEYDRWVQAPGALPDILQARRAG